MKTNNVPVICAECVDVGRIVVIRDVNHLSCGLMNDRPVFGSKPNWCPKGSIWPDEELKKWSSQ